MIEVKYTNDLDDLIPIIIDKLGDVEYSVLHKSRILGGWVEFFNN